MTHNVVYLFSTPNLGNYQADMTISPLAINQYHAKANSKGGICRWTN